MEEDGVRRDKEGRSRRSGGKELKQIKKRE